MTDRNRRLALLFAALAIIALLLLAVGLDGMELQPGRPMSGRVTTGEEETASPPVAITLANTLLLTIGLVLAIALPLALLNLLFGADRRKRWFYVLALLVGLLAVYLGMRANAPREPVAPPTVAAPGAEPEEEALSGPGAPVLELEVQPPAWLGWLAAILFALIAAGLLLGTSWLFWTRAQRGPQAPSPLLGVAGHAQAALFELEAGGDVRDVVMRCYLEMSRVLEKERGLARDEAMTPREFETALRGTGLPHEAVARLTRLFEEVRYGAACPGRTQEQQAVASLTAIVAACRSQT